MRAVSCFARGTAEEGVAAKRRGAHSRTRAGMAASRLPAAGGRRCGVVLRVKVKRRHSARRRAQSSGGYARARMSLWCVCGVCHAALVLHGAPARQGWRRALWRAECARSKRAHGAEKHTSKTASSRQAKRARAHGRHKRAYEHEAA